MVACSALKEAYAEAGILEALNEIAASQIWKFIEPGLYPHERQGMRFAAVGATSVCIQPTEDEPDLAGFVHFLGREPAEHHVRLPGLRHRAQHQDPPRLLCQHPPAQRHGRGGCQGVLDDALAKGDEVITSGGLLGKVTKVSDSYITLEISVMAEKPVETIVQRTAVTSILPKGTIKAL
mgnify:CR=1 FL=1